ncbi:ER degradation-enhancing alpha-mannosidase-like protein 2 [Adelges cooleyi]|uniref:ER degradation-enhancing alpha-mannosidase-like protein 2 n=1 Tax=Adelges cooleyi TaxID=133065 RepID=UPI00218024DC|nr:ER degradation-enhancing alpha-mannosidase-like protein 2 [Adelges cooleyi]
MPVATFGLANSLDCQVIERAVRNGLIDVSFLKYKISQDHESIWKNMNLLYYLSVLLLVALVSSVRHYNKRRLKQLRSEVKEMFEHAYYGYMHNAYPYDELRPLTCDGVDTWGSYSLSLIDSLDTLIVMGLHEEFNKAVDRLRLNISFDADINVSVFETNIRVVGGLLSAHMLSHRASSDLEMGWPCNGPLLRMAEDVARRLLPAFNTPTGMPYGTVNLRFGVPEGETTVTCTAGVGTFILEFGTLTRLTGDPVFEEVALKALHSLFHHKSKIGLMGNHLDVATGQWIAHDSGIGGGIDSYFEYLVKGSLLFNMPHLRSMFDELRKPIDEYALTKGGWYFWVSMNKGQVTMPVYQSLESYWPGLLSLIGDIDTAMKAMTNYHDVLKVYGFTPEVYNVLNQDAVRDSFPLRPELVESAMYLYKATQGDPYLLDIGSDLLQSIQHTSRTRCGYATIKSCKQHTLQNRMESFFLAETTKYLYLLFDPDNFLHNDGSHGKVWMTATGRECMIDAGGFIFNTEAHPIDPGLLHCCYTPTNTRLHEKLSKEYVPPAYAFEEDKTESVHTGDVEYMTDSHEYSQQQHQDHQPEFKSDHPEPLSSSPPTKLSSLYETDDQQQRGNDVQTTPSTLVTGTVEKIDRDHDNDEDDDKDDVQQYTHVPTTKDFYYRHDDSDDEDDEPSWQLKQQQWMSSLQKQFNGTNYQTLTCRMTNNYYTAFRW